MDIIVCFIAIIAFIIIIWMIRDLIAHYLTVSSRQLYTTEEVCCVADIVIIGGGTAGCVVARRLADKYPDKSVVVIERGQDLRHDRNVYRAENSGNIAYIPPYSQSIVTDYPGVTSSVGAIYGGCSSHNYGLVVQGTKEHYIRKWLNKLNLTKCDLDKYINRVYSMIDVFYLPSSISPLPYIVPMIGVAIKDGLVPVKEALDVYLNHGPLRANSCLTKKLIGAMTSTSPDINVVNNYNANGVDNCISSTQQLYVDRVTGVRASINRQYLPDGYTPKNLRLIAGAEVDTIDPASSTVTLITNQTVHARDKMVLCTGGILSPYLLLKSNITLNDMVGKNLINHYGTQAVFAIKGITDFSSGPIAFLPHRSSEDVRKWQILTSGSALTNLTFLKQQGVDTDALTKEGYIFTTYLIYLMDPQIRGEIVVSRDNNGQGSFGPKVNLNLFKNTEDNDSLISGMRWIGENYKYLKNVECMDIKAIFPPSDVWDTNGPKGDDILFEYIKKGVGIADHYSCTMTKCVDSNLVLNGYPNFHVVDASTFPYISDGNTEFPAIMIGEIGADKIIQTMTCDNSTDTSNSGSDISE